MLNYMVFSIVDYRLEGEGWKWVLDDINLVNICVRGIFGLGFGENSLGGIGGICVLGIVLV